MTSQRLDTHRSLGGNHHVSPMVYNYHWLFLRWRAIGSRYMPAILKNDPTRFMAS